MYMKSFRFMQKSKELLYHCHITVGGLEAIIHLFLLNWIGLQDGFISVSQGFYLVSSLLFANLFCQLAAVWDHSLLQREMEELKDLPHFAIVINQPPARERIKCACTIGFYVQIKCTTPTKSKIAQGKKIYLCI